MLGGANRNAFGLGLTLGMCLTLVFCLYVWWGLESVISTSSDTLPQWIIAGFGVVATAISAWAVLLLNQTLKQTDLATKAAQDAVLVTIRMARLQTQAYLTFSGSEVDFATDGQETVAFRVKPKFKNTGQSPGMIVYSFCDCKIVDDLSLSFKHQAERVSSRRTKLNVGPGEERWIDGVPVTIEQFKYAKENRQVIIFFGCIEFVDTFDSVCRLEDFCFSVLFHDDPKKNSSHEWHTHSDYHISFL